ncbi:MAG TPA: magnesium/cobalt transporter CorA [Burkholderiales bacterium]|nr:magnesium/cobalt transporter CorA [Burkholderiales bacterium]
MLVNCFAYQDGKRIADQFNPAEIGRYIGRPECLVWVALKDPVPGEFAALQDQFGLHELAIEDASVGHQRPKVEEYGDSIFAVLHVIEIVNDELVVGEVDIFAGPNYILSVRNRAEKGFAEVRARCEREPDLLRLGSGFVLYALMDAVVDRYFPIMDALETELERLEERMFSGGTARANIEDMYALKRKLMTLKHAVGPLLEGVGKLYGGRVPKICAGTQEYYRDVYDHLSRINQSIDALREMVTTALSVNLALITVAENETTKRLAACAALVAVPTLVAGVYGMNFEHMPELRWAYGYPLSLAIMGVIDTYLFYRFRRAGWL